MDVKAAAIRVLRQAGTALHARDIAARMMAAGLWQSRGKTPAATVAARLYSDIKQAGNRSPFIKAGAQTFALRDSAEMPSGGGPAATTVEKLSKPSAANAGFSFSDCAEKVLEAFGDKQPMHYKRITEKALQEGWLITGGKTPEATMYAQIISETRRRQRRGERPRFVRHGRGYVGLSQWQGRGLTFEIEQHNLRVGEALREKLRAMKPDKFEELIEQLLPEMGFEKVELTRFRGDGGIDVRGDPGPIYTMLAVLLCPKLRQSRRAERSLVIPNERQATPSGAVWGTTRRAWPVLRSSRVVSRLSSATTLRFFRLAGAQNRLKQDYQHSVNRP